MKPKLLILLFLALSLPQLDRYRVIVKAQPTNAAYAFLHIEQSGSTSIHLVHRESVAIVKSLPVPEGYIFARVILGVESHWLAVIFAAPIGGSANDLLQLVNIDTLETRDLLKGKLSTVINSYDDLDQTVAWSPDGRFIAVSSAVTDLWDVHIFDTTTQKLSSMGLQLASPASIVWSADSSRLAVVSESCEAATCNQTITVVDAATNRLEKSYDLTAALEIPFGARFCKLTWSPDGRYIGFIFNCDLTSIDIIKEIYLLDLQTEKVQRLTNFKREMLQQEGSMIAAGDYRMYWQKDGTLVVGVLVYSNLSMLSQTLSYTFADLKPTLLLEGNSEEWELNPIDSTVALRFVEAYNANDLSPESVSTKLVNLEANNVSEIQSLEAGCNLDWSPDGMVLAYSIHSENNCQNPILGFAFYNVDEGRAAQYTIPLGSVGAGNRIVPLGWVQIGAAE
ncbi:MAG: hypothetical protein KF726_18170 [Anaerolineae bacterium]|nr:hypothetical protein [Anaerolineae bacterium]